MKLTKSAAAVFAASLAAVTLVGSAAAYFSDVETAENTFTVGSISIDLTEPEWERWNQSDPDPLVPDQEIPKDPTVTNTGDNDAFVFATVKVPTARIVTANENGTRNAAAETQLFGYKLNSGWTLVQDKVTGGSAIDVAGKTGTYGIHDAIREGTGYVTYVYAYTGTSPQSMERVAPEDVTPALFPAVKFANAIESQGLEKSTPVITVKAYAIQADFINNGDTVTDGSNAGTPVVSPAEVWKILETQNTAS